MKSALGVPPRKFELQKPEEPLYEKINAIAQEKVREVFHITEKTKRRESLDEILQMAFKEIGAEDEPSQKMVKIAFEETYRKQIRKLILEKKQRIDGRSLSEIRLTSS